MPDYASRAVPRLDLGAAAMEFVDTQQNFVAEQIMPVFRTPVKAGKYPAITRESLVKTPDVKRAPRGEYNRDDYAAEDRSFACQEYGLEGLLDDSERALHANDFDAELSTVQTTRSKILRAQEVRAAAAIFNTTTFTGAALYTDVSAAPWGTAGSDVIGQINTAKEKVVVNTGMLPNTLLFNYTNLNNLKANTAIIDRIKYTARPTDAEIINALADLFGVERIIVANTIKNSANEGQTFSGTSIWSSTYAMLCVTASNGQSLNEPSLARTFLWSEDSPANSVVEQYREENRRSDVFRVRHTVQELVVDPYFGHLLEVN